MSVRERVLVGLAALSLISAAPGSASAAFDAKDGQVLGRTLGYTGDGMTGIAVVGIVYAPDRPASKQEAESIGAVIGDGLSTGRIQLRARLVPVAQLGSETGLSALYVTSNLSSDMETIVAAARRLKVPTVSIDMTCVLSGNCVVGFTSQPTVQIILNQGAAEQIGVHFLQAFRMLVREK